MDASLLPSNAEYFRILPETILTVFGIVVMVLEAVAKGKRSYLGVISLVGIALAFASNLSVVTDLVGMNGGFGGAFHNMIVIDAFGVFFRAVVMVVGFLSILGSLSYLEREEANSGEYYALILFSLVGQCILATAGDLLMVFIGLEISSIATYILAGFLRDDRRANESALKYFLLGSFATAFLLYGIAWIFGSLGSTNLEVIRQGMETANGPILAVAAALIFVGLGFKVAVAPFQMWAPDVYQGAASPVSGFMSAGPKAAAFAVFFRLFLVSFMPLHDRWATLVWGCALGTMFIGNLGALVQTNIKRLLGYSSIAHAGYVMVALASASKIGMRAAMFYLASYAFMNIGAFLVIGYVASRNERFTKIEDLAGLGRKEPVTAALLSIFVFSLIGVPLTGGFFGKFYVFQAALDSHLVWLTILGLVNSAIAAYYYLKIIIAIYMKEPDYPVLHLAPPPVSLRIAMWLSAIGVLTLGLFPGLLLQFATTSASLP